MVKEDIKFDAETTTSEFDARYRNAQEVEEVKRLHIVPLSGVEISEVAARLQSRGGDVSRDNIFEILPQCSITAGGEECDWESDYLRRRDEVLAATSGGDITGITVGSKLLAFERCVDEPLQQMQFSALVDFIVWRRSIILMGLSSSRIVLVDPKTFGFRYIGKALAQSEDAINPKKKFFVDAFIHSNPDPTKMDVVVVPRNGNLFIISNIVLSDGTMDCTFDQNTSVDVDFGATKEVMIYDLNIESAVVCASSPSRHKVITLEEYGRCMVLDTNDLNSGVPGGYVTVNLFSTLNHDNTKSSVSVTPKKLMSFEGMLFVLLSNGSLQMFITSDLKFAKSLQLPQDSMKVHDFTLILNNAECTVKLWALYGNGEETFVGIFNGPRFKPEFSFKLPMISKPNTGTTSYPSLFKFPNNVSPYEEPISILEMADGEIRFYNIMETSTDVTLQKLLSRGKYSEAEDLALQYNKNLDIVRKAEAKDKLNRLISAHLTEGREPSEALFRELLEVLGKIEDAEFVCNFCVQAHLPKVNWIKEILAFGKGRVCQCPGSAVANTLLLTIKKFYTFELVFPQATIVDWEAFIAADNSMFAQSMKFLQSGCFDKCERVWRRHSEDFVTDITLGDFLPFFNILFEHQLKKPESRSLLQTLLPFAVEKVASAGDCSPEDEDVGPDVGARELAVLISLIHRQVCSLEGSVNWPINAIEFSKALNSVILLEIKRLEGVRSERESWTNRKKVIVQKINSKLNHLLQVLDELAELKRNHSIRIPFADYTQNEIPEVVSKLLYKLLSKEEVESFVSQYLKPYAERKGLDLDFLFSEHIKSVLQQIHYYHQAINIPHEERIVCLINLISSSKAKLLSTLQIAEEWPVPWTPGIDGMVKQILDIFPRDKLNSECMSLYDNIFLMRKQVPYRVVLRKYRLNGIKLGSSRCHVTMAILRILKLKQEGYLEDCKELLKNIPGGAYLDDIRLEYLQFCSKMYDEGIEADDVVPMELMKNEKLKKACSQRVLLELQQFEGDDGEDFYSPEERQRIISIYSTFAVDAKDARARMIAKLKEFIPSIPMNVVYEDEFPYVVLTHLLEPNVTEVSSAGCVDPQKLIRDCRILSRITDSYLPDILMTAGAYFCREDLPGNPGSMVWTLAKLIVAHPLPVDQNNTIVNTDLLQTAGFTMAKYLLQQCPDLTLDEMEILHEFLSRLTNFDELCKEICMLMYFYRIFLNLKEQEVPLEKDFLEVYKWLAGEPTPWATIKSKLEFIGETLLRFGESDIFNSVFKSIRRHLYIFATKLEGPSKTHYFGLINQIETLMTDLWNKRKSFTPENDRLLQKLVEQLNECGIRVNQYALKLRNKEKLLERLLSQKLYMLASDVATYFRYHNDLKIWSKILQGLITSGKLSDLRLVLETVRTVTQLWMLPEFADAWKKVSESDQNFRDLCPIPLD